MRHKIDLLEPVVEDLDKGSTQTFREHAAGVLASVTPKLVSEQTLGAAGGANIAAQYDITVVVRFRGDVDVGWRIAWRGNEYRVEGMIDVDAERRWLEIGCVRVE